MNDTAVSEQSQEMIDGLLARMRGFLVQMVAQAGQVRTPAEAAELERRFRADGLDQLRLLFQDLLQQAVDAGDGGRECPSCQGRRRHKGCAPLKLLTSVGEVCVEGVYWACPSCGQHGHAARRVSVESITGPMRELVCLLGITQSSFAHASAALSKLLGVRLSAPTIAATTQEEGRRMAQEEAPAPRPVSGTLVGSCDGMMVNTREEQWKQMWAFRFDDDKGRRHSGATLRPAAEFFPRLREEALRQQAALVNRFAFVSDAAECIKLGVSEFLPEATVHVIDIFHAYQHVHEAAKLIHGEGTPKAAAWAKQWCEELFLCGGAAVRQRLAHARFGEPARQQALDALCGYLKRNEPHMNYPAYREQNLPISSGPMESTCKQMGLRLKGAGMRWCKDNLDPMAELISQWCDGRWDGRWKAAA